MCLSYSSYKSDIESFDSEEYIKNFQDSILINLFYDFISFYKEIENEDFKKPIFSQTSKFKKIPNNYKNYKYLKISRDNEESKNIWTFESPSNETDKITVLIKTYLNKISQDTYKKISLDFINELILFDYPYLFEILSKEIINKCLFDNKYRNLYINLCYKIWSNRQIHYNLIEISNINNNFKWKCKFDENINSTFIFSSEINAKNDAFNKINFKKYFLDYIQKLYISKDLSFDNLNEEEMFIKKKKIILLVELIGILYIEKYINFDIINIIIIDLLHINNNFEEIKEIEFESLYILLKLIKENKNSYNDIIDLKIIFNQFINIIKEIISNNNISKRSNFFLNDTILMFESFINENKQNIKKNNDFENKIKNNIIDFFKNNNNTNLDEIINNYHTLNKLDKQIIINNCIEIFISQKNKNKLIIQFFNEIKDFELLYSNLENITNNINDIMLDVPDANQKILFMINNINYENNKKDEIINILKNIEESDHSDYESDDSDF